MKCRKWMNRLSTIAMTGIAIFALNVTTGVANASCYWYFGQDEMPEGAEKLRKF